MEKTITAIVQDLTAQCQSVSVDGFSTEMECKDAFKLAIANKQIAESVDTPWEEMDENIRKDFTQAASENTANAIQKFRFLQKNIIELEEKVHKLESVLYAVEDEKFLKKHGLSDAFVQWVLKSWSECADQLEDLADRRNDVESAMVEYYGENIREEIYQ